jgi:DNA ligase-1
MNKFKPMLADDADLKRLQYPVLASPKLDGVRATFQAGTLVTRSLKPLANKFIDSVFTCIHPLDGELIVGDPRSKSVFRDTMKVVSAHTADITDLQFYVFDLVTSDFPFRDRLAFTIQAIQDNKRFVHVPHALVVNETELLKMEEIMLEQGYEGLMLRDPLGPYKFGRSTVAEGTLLKLKRKMRSEAVVTGFVEQMHNGNEAKLDNLGYTERSSHQANKVPMDTLGALQVRDLITGVDFNIGTGFTFADRDEIWKNQDQYLHRIASYEYLPIGVKDRPRHPTFVGWRIVEDM